MEVCGDLLQRRELIALRVRSKGSVGDAFDEKTLTRVRAPRFGVSSGRGRAGIHARRWRNAQKLALGYDARR
jgi:hypothetical protein